MEYVGHTAQRQVPGPEISQRRLSLRIAQKVQKQKVQKQKIQKKGPARGDLAGPSKSRQGGELSAPRMTSLFCLQFSFGRLVPSGRELWAEIRAGWSSVPWRGSRPAVAGVAVLARGNTAHDWEIERMQRLDGPLLWLVLR